MTDRKNQMMDAMGEIDPKYIEEAMQKQENPKGVWISLAVAVAAVMVITLVFAVNGKNKNKVYDPVSGRLLAEDTRERSDADIGQPETAIIWEWDQMTVYEQYGSISINGNTYSSRGVMVEQEHLGDYVGEGSARGYDIYEDKNYEKTADVFQIQGMPTASLIAVNLGVSDEYMVYLNDALKVPDTLDEFVTMYSLSDAVLFTGYYIEKNKYRGITEETSGKIWELLTACTDVPTMLDMDNPVNDGAKKILELTVSSDRLGVKNKALIISSDGYVWTNMFESAYCFDITEEIATELIKYVNKNNFTAQAPATISNKTIAVTIVSVKDDYIIINDGASLKNEAEGREYKISLSDKNFKRYVEHYAFKAGDVACLTYDGRIFEDTKDTIENPVAIYKADASSDGTISVPE